MTKDTIKIKQALEALQANHDWHKDNRDYDGYQGSALCEITEQAIATLFAAALSAATDAQPQEQPDQQDWKTASDKAQILAAELRGNVAEKDYEAWAAEVLPLLDKLTFMHCGIAAPVTVQPASKPEVALMCEQLRAMKLGPCNEAADMLEALTRCATSNKENNNEA